MAYPIGLIPTDATDAGSAKTVTTTAGTSVLIPSTATGALYMTSILLSNGATASTLRLGYGVAAAAPTGAAILIDMFFAINGGMPYCPIQPIKVPSSNNLLFTVIGGTTASATATYYVAP